MSKYDLNTPSAQQIYTDIVGIIIGALLTWH